MSGSKALLATLRVRPVLVERVQKAQTQDQNLSKIINEVRNGTCTDFSLKDDGTLMLGNRLCVPNEETLKREIMEEAHCTAYSMHPGSTKMYRNLKENYLWQGIKKEIVDYMERCLVC